MATTPTPAPKVSWLKKFGQFAGKLLGIVAKDTKPVADIATPVLEGLFPQFAAPIADVDNVINNIASEAIKAESLVAVGTSASGTGAQKLESVLSVAGPVIDGWVASKFPGSAAISAASKAGLINAIVAILNEVSPAQNVPAAS